MHTALLVLALGVVAVNVMVFWHARALLRFSGAGEKTKDPEELSRLERALVLLTGAHVPKPSDAQTPSDYGLTYERRTIPVNDRVRLGAFWIPNAAGAQAEQAARCVIFFHGFTASKAQLLPEAAAFHARGYAALLVDFRGSGESSESYTSVGFDEAEDVIAAVRYATTTLGARAPLLYGRSMGAAAVLRAFATGLDSASIRGVVLEGVFDRMLSTVKARFSSMHVPPTPFAHLLVLWGGAQAGFWAFAHNPINYAPLCKAPVLMLHGSADPRATLEQAEGVFAALGGEKQLCLFPGALHEPLMAKDPARWNTAVDAWLKGLSHAADRK